MRALPGWLLSALCLLSACAQGPGPSSSPEGATINETRVFIANNCAVIDVGQAGQEALPAVLGGALLSAAIDKGFDLLAGAIRKAGEAETQKSSGSTGGYFHEVRDDGETIIANKSLGCIIAIKGEFGPRTAAGKDFRRWKDDSRLKSVAEKYRLVADPEVYFEGSLEFSLDRSSFRVKSQYLEFNKPGIGGWTPHELVVALNFTLPAGESGKTFAVGLLNFGKLSANTQFSATDIASKVTRWMPLPEVSAGGKQHVADYAKISADVKTTKSTVQKLALLAGETPSNTPPALLSLDAKTAAVQAKLEDVRISRAMLQAKFLDANRKAQQAVVSEQINNVHELSQLREQRAKLTVTKDLEQARKSLKDLEEEQKKYNEDYFKAITPFDVEGVFVETRSANKFLLAVADILDGSKATVVQAVKEEFVSSERKKADISASELELEAFRKERIVVELEAELAELGEDASQSTREKLVTKIAVAKREADIAARKAGKAPPFGT
jgi:hypothetical protein